MWLQLDVIGGEVLENDVSFRLNYIEDKLSKIASKIAKATEYSEQAASLCVDSQSILIVAQNELSELYMSLEDVVTPKSSSPKKTKGKLELTLTAPKQAKQTR